MEYVGLLVFVFIVAVVANIIMGLLDLRMKSDMKAFIEEVANGFYEEMGGQQQGVQPQVIALNPEQIQAIAQLVIKIMEENKKE